MDPKAGIDLVNKLNDYFNTKNQLEPFYEAENLLMTLLHINESGDMTEEECEEEARKLGEEFEREFGFDALAMVPDPDLCEIHETLSEKLDLIRLDIERILIDCKMFPIAGLSPDILEKLEKEFVNPQATSFKLTLEEMLARHKGDASVQGTPIYAYSEQRLRLIENQIDTKMLLDREAMTRRLNEVPPSVSRITVHKTIQDSYRQVVNCYVHGFFEASCALARAVVDGATDMIIESKNAGHQRGNAKLDPTKKEGWQVLRDLGFDEENLKMRRKIAITASGILHKQKTADDSKALEVIKETKVFLENLYQWAYDSRKKL